MEEWQKRALDRLADTGYIATIQGLAKSHSAAFWWHDSSRPLGAHIEHNGTITFVHSGTEILGISCHHVHEAWLRDKAANPNLVCQIGSITFDPVRQLVDCDPRLDLATYRLSDVIVAGSRSIVHNSQAWPPADIEEGGLLILGGWPGILRSERGGETDFYFASFIGLVHQASSEHIAVHLNIAESHGPAGLIIPENPNLGGASGGPVFRIREDGLVTLEFVGIVYEYSAPLELIRARRASSIRADGKLIR